MPVPSMQALTLASLQNAVSNDLYADLASDRCREFALCAARVLARLRADAETAPTLAAARLTVWRELARSTSDPPAPNGSHAQPVEPLAAMNEAVGRIGRDIDQRSGEVAYLDALAAPTSEAAVQFSRTLAAARDYLDAYEEALPAAGISADRPAEDTETVRSKLSRYLIERFPELPADPIHTFRIVPGGRGKETTLFELVSNSVLPTRLVLRRDVSNSPTGTAVYAEFPLLRKLEELGLPVPRPIVAEQDPSHLGGGFMIVTEAVGARRGGELFAELNDLSRLDASFGPELTRALARLHTLTEHPSGAALGGHHAGSTPLEAVRQFQGLWRSLKHRPAFSVATDLGFAWLLSHPLPADRPRRLVHGDVGLHNILVREGKLAALLDWELTHLGDPAEDLGYIRAPLMQHLLPWGEFVNVYTAAGGDPRACDRHAVDWYSVWAHTRNSIYVAMHYEWAATGQRKDIECFNAGIDFFSRTQLYIVRELELAWGAR